MKTFQYTTTSQTLLADLHTPVGVYLRLRDLYPQSVLMECCDYHDKDSARSFIGIHPIASVAINHGTATIHYPDGTTHQEPLSERFSTAQAIHALTDSIQVEGADASSATPHSMRCAISRAFP